LAADIGQTVESAEAHAGMGKCIVVLSTRSLPNPIMRTKQWKEFKRENMAHEEWQRFDSDIPSAKIYSVRQSIPKGKNRTGNT
jgi:hypothetical protein